MKKLILNAISAGLLISIVSYCNLVSGNKYIGAALFAFGLIVICKYSMSLFTGMAGYINKTNIGNFCVAVLVNCLFAFGFGALASLDPAARERALEICAGKLSNDLLRLFVSAVFCGILIYLGVDMYKKTEKFIGIIFAIPIFVLCGFDHTVADLFYYGARGSYNAADLLPLLAIIVGNIAGSNIMRALIVLAKDKEKAK